MLALIWIFYKTILKKCQILKNANQKWRIKDKQLTFFILFELRWNFLSYPKTKWLRDKLYVLIDTKLPLESQIQNILDPECESFKKFYFTNKHIQTPIDEKVTKQIN